LACEAAEHFPLSCACVVHAHRFPQAASSLAQIYRIGLTAGTAARCGAASRDFQRLQTTLTKLVSDHLRNGTHDPRQFVRVVTECEQVHIVTFRENYDAMKAGGDYSQAGIVLILWEAIAPETQLMLWKRVLRGKVSNAEAFRTLS
jgi:hypothetical protein